MNRKPIWVIATLIFLLALLCACDATAPEQPQEQPREQAQDNALTGEATILLDGETARVSGDGVTVENGVVSITRGGSYHLSGVLTDGRILVNAKGETVELVLDGVDITCSYGSPLYVYEASTAVLRLAENSTNTLTDGTRYTFADTLSNAAEEEPNACLYSKDDLVICGSGALTINANYNNGITSKDTLVLRDCALAVNAVNHGVNGKDSNTIEGATLTVRCGGDAVRSTNDSDPTLGWISITDSALTLTAGEDGVQAETWATLEKVECTITTGGGVNARHTDDTSAKGVKAGGTLTLVSGVYRMDCADDAFHTNGELIVETGEYRIASGDDAFHADGTLTIRDGVIDISACYEGLEGSDINILGGTIDLVSSDDGVNAAGGADGSGFMDRGGRVPGSFGMGGGNHTLTISGGTLHVLAGGDGLDSNGSLAVTGGEITVCSTGMNDGALDCDGSLAVSGGTLFAASAGSMAQSPNAPEQNAVFVSFGKTLSAGTQVSFSVGGKRFDFALSGQATSAVFSAPELRTGEVCTVEAGGELIAELTLAEGLTSYGQMMGGFGGGAGGWKNFNGNGNLPTDSQNGGAMFDPNSDPTFAQRPNRGDKMPTGFGTMPPGGASGANA